jgi:uncharacterized protein YbjT (DUF2867 family)
MILVVGATGMLGGMIARRLLEDDREVRVLVRPGSDHQALVEAGAEPVSGDLKNPGSLGAACGGVTTLITTANSVGRGGEDNTQTVDLDGNQALIDAASEAGVEHFIFISALGADADSPIDFLQAKGRTEQHLRQSGMEYTILQPNYFMDVWVPTVVGLPLQQGEPVRLIGEAKRHHSIVAARDVAAFVAAAVDNPAARNQVLMVGGPEPLCWQDIVTRTGQMLGREIPVEFLPIGAELPGLPPVVTELMTATEMYDSPLEMDSLANAYGVSLTPLEEWLRQSPLAQPV